MTFNRQVYMKEYRLKHHEVLKERKKLWARNNRNREYDRLYSRKVYRARLPQKYANNLISRLVKLGTIVKLPCEVCQSRLSFAHHDDYKKPYDVRWLCKSHHQKWHAENGAGLNRDTL